MNFFEESELERQQRLYELQRLYQEYEQGNLNDISDDISEAASYQPAEHEVSPEFLLRGQEPERLGEQRDVPDRSRDHLRPVHQQHLMDMDGSIIAAGVQAGIQGAQGVRVGDLRHDYDPRAFQRVVGNADVARQLADATRRELSLRKDYDDLRRAFDDLVARMKSPSAPVPAVEAPIDTVTQTLLATPGGAAISLAPSASDDSTRRPGVRDVGGVCDPLLPDLVATAPPTLSAQLSSSDSRLPVALRSSRIPAAKEFTGRVKGMIATILANGVTIGDKSTLPEVSQWIHGIIASSGKISKWYSALAAAAIGMTSSSVVIHVSGQESVRRQVLEALDGFVMNSSQQTLVSMAAASEQQLVRRGVVAAFIVANNESLRYIDASCGRVFDQLVLGPLGGLLVDSAGLISAGCILLKAKGATNTTRVDAAVDAFANVPALRVSGPETFVSVANSAVERCIRRIEELRGLKLTIEAISAGKEIAVFPNVAGTYVDASLRTTLVAKFQEFANSGSSDISRLQLIVSELEAAHPVLANSPGYFEKSAETSAFSLTAGPATKADALPATSTRSARSGSPFRNPVARAANLRAGSPSRSASSDVGSSTRRETSVVPAGALSNARGGVGSRSKDRSAAQHDGGLHGRSRPEARQQPGGRRPSQERGASPRPHADEFCQHGAQCGFLHRPGGCKKRHPQHEVDAAAVARRADQNNVGGQDVRNRWASQSPGRAAGESYSGYSLQLEDWPLPSEAAPPPSRPRPRQAVFREALELHFPAGFGRRVLRPPVRPIGGPILKAAASASPPAQYYSIRLSGSVSAAICWTRSNGSPPVR
jgi:hypothetical protein